MWGDRGDTIAAAVRPLKRSTAPVRTLRTYALVRTGDEVRIIRIALQAANDNFPPRYLGWMKLAALASASVALGVGLILFS